VIAGILGPLLRNNPSLKWPHRINGSLLVIISNVALVTGFVDVSTISICTVQLPTTVLIGLGNIAGMGLATYSGVVVVDRLSRKWAPGPGFKSEGEKGPGVNRNITIIRGDVGVI
jgi:hypothetical protein